MANISQLDETYPDGSVHKVYVLDDDLRALKRALKDTFPNITDAVTPTHTELNYLDGLVNNIQTQIDQLSTQRQALVTRGAIYAGRVAYDGTGTVLPSGWSSARDSLGNYTLTFPTRTVYGVTLNIDASGATDYWQCTISVGAISTTTAEIKVVNATTGAALDQGFFFHLHANT